MRSVLYFPPINSVEEFERRAAASREAAAAPATTTFFARPVFDFSKLTVLEKAAMISMSSENQWKRALICRLTAIARCRITSQDYRALRKLGWAEFKHGKGLHELTWEGRDAVRELGKQLCVEFNLHMLLERSENNTDKSFYCPCGWTTAVRKSHTSWNNAHERFNQHVIEIERRKQQQAESVA